MREIDIKYADAKSWLACDDVQNSFGHTDKVHGNSFGGIVEDNGKCVGKELDVSKNLFGTPSIALTSTMGSSTVYR